MPVDLSTAVLIEYYESTNDDGNVDSTKGDNQQVILSSKAYLHSTSVLKMFLLMTFPWYILGTIALAVPIFVRDWAYQTFARNRGTIWKTVKRITGMGDTQMIPYKSHIIGLPIDNDDELSKLPTSWGFSLQEDQPPPPPPTRSSDDDKVKKTK